MPHVEAGEPTGQARHDGQSLRVGPPPARRVEPFEGETTDPEINPNYLRPKMFMFRLQKIMDEYAGGVTAQFTTSKPLLDKGLELLTFLKEDSANLGAEDLHELMRCWENYHRTFQAEAHVRAILFREETRWPGYYYRGDALKLDDDNWHVLTVSRRDPKTGEYTMEKAPCYHIVSEGD